MAASRKRSGLYEELKRRNVIRVATAYVVASWLIIQVAETILPAYGFGEEALRLIITLLAIASVPTLVFSWVFELTPEGLKREVEVDHEDSITRFAGKRIDRVIMVLLALAVGYFALDKFVLDPARDAALIEEAAHQARSDALVESYGDQSIAVLPFVNMSADPEQEYFSDGISEELLNLLGQIPQLRVISRSSSFSFKDKDVPIPDVAKHLKVAHVLEGSVRKAGDRVRITAQLIEARSDTHLWSNTYDRKLDDIFAVQDEIAAAIGAALEVRLAPAGGEAVQSTTIEATSTDAYEAYLRGRELVHLRNREATEESVRQLERAVQLDDGFAPAHAQLAIATMLQTSYVSSDRERARRKAIRHLDRAQTLEPDLTEAHLGRAVLAAFANDPESQIEHAREALASNPNSIEALSWLRGGLSALGHGEEAHAILVQMLAIDPLSIAGREDYAAWLAGQGRVEEAHEVAEQLIAQNPSAGYRAHARISFLVEGELAEALYWALKTPHDGFAHAWNIFSLVGEYDEARRVSAPRIAYWIDANEGRWEDAIQASQREVQLTPDGFPMVRDAALIMYHAGRLDEALPLYERAVALAPEGLSGLGPHYSMQLALARRNAGDQEGAQKAAELAMQEHAAAHATGRRYYMVKSMIAAFEHEPDRAIEAQQSAIRHGLRWPMFFDDPIFEDLRDDPRSVAVRQELDAILAAEHEKILQLICFNNPVPDEWQPMPETCEDVIKGS